MWNGTGNLSGDESDDEPPFDSLAGTAGVVGFLDYLQRQARCPHSRGVVPSGSLLVRPGWICEINPVRLRITLALLAASALSTGSHGAGRMRTRPSSSHIRSPRLADHTTISCGTDRHRALSPQHVVGQSRHCGRGAKG